MQQGVFIRVFIASPSDVSNERDEACRVIHDWNAAHSLDRSILVEPVRVETHSQAVQGGHPQDLINGQLLARCDLLLAIFWTRLGTPTKKDISGTVQEIREFAETKGAERVMLFFCEKELPSNVDLEQVKSVREFKREMQDKGLYIQYKSESEFARSFRQQLEMRMNSVMHSEEATEFLPNRKTEVRLEPECCTLIAVGSLAQHSNIMVVSDMSGTQISANHTVYSEQGNGRSEARWKGAVLQLKSLGLIQDVGYENEIFELTKEGYKLADLLWRIVLLRKLQESQKDEHEYVDPESWIGHRLSDQTLEKSLVAEKMEELESIGAVECVYIDGRIPNCRLSSAGRKTLREHGWVQFAESDANKS